MKCYVILIALILSAPIWAKDRQILKCLGEEEKQFHLKKQSGPVFDLNQRLISEIVQIPDIDIPAEDLKRICTNSHVSLNLLHESITKGKSLFIIPSSLSGIQKQMTEGMIEDYMEATKEIFLVFISQIQTLAPTPTCLKEEVPELEPFFTDIKYLQEEIDIKLIFRGRDMKIFEKIKNYQEIFDRCKSRIKTKKKPKSRSTSTSKKR